MSTFGIDSTAQLTLAIVSDDKELTTLEQRLNRLANTKPVEVVSKTTNSELAQARAQVKVLEAELATLGATALKQVRASDQMSRSMRQQVSEQRSSASAMRQAAREQTKLLDASLKGIEQRRRAEEAYTTWWLAEVNKRSAAELRIRSQVLSRVTAETIPVKMGIGRTNPASAQYIGQEGVTQGGGRALAIREEAVQVATLLKIIEDAERESYAKRRALALEARRSEQTQLQQRIQQEKAYTQMWADELRKRDAAERASVARSIEMRSRLMSRVTSESIATQMGIGRTNPASAQYIGQAGVTQGGGNTLASRTAAANLAVSLGSRTSGDLSKQTAELGRHTQGLEKAAAASRALALSKEALHSSLRGVTGVLGGLWLSYARMVPVLLATAAAAKTVRDAFSTGLDLNFMSQFAAVVETRGMTSGDSLRELRNSIAQQTIDASRTSIFTTTQHAEALQKLALAGIESARGINLLATASNAAVFGQVQLGESTQMILDTMYNFNMASNDAELMAESFQKVGDIMAFTAVTVNTSFADLAKAFANITGVAGTFNIEIEEASVLLQSLAEAGIRGQRAGTFVRNFLDDVLGAPISQRAERALGDLGIERFNPDDFGQYGVSQYIDNLISKLKELEFVDQQNTIRAITNQRSRRVLRQELLKSYDEEATMLNRVTELALSADGSLAKMAENLADSGKYALIMAGAAYDAAVADAYQSIDSDQAFVRIGQTLQETFRSDEFQSLVNGLVAGVGSILESLTNLFQWLVSHKDIIVGSFKVIGTAMLTLFSANVLGAGIASLQNLTKVFGFTSAAAAAASIGLARVSTAIRAVTAAAMANPVTALVTAITAGAVAWNEYAKAKERALKPEDRRAQTEERLAPLYETRDRLEEALSGDFVLHRAQLEKRLQQVNAAIAEMAESTEEAIQNQLVTMGETLAQSIRQAVVSTNEAISAAQDALRQSPSEGREADTDAYQTWVELEGGITRKMAEFEAERAKLIEEIRKARDSGAPEAEIAAMEGQLAAVRAEAAALADAWDRIARNTEGALEQLVNRDRDDTYVKHMVKDLEGLGGLISSAQDELYSLVYPPEVVNSIQEVLAVREQERLELNAMQRAKEAAAATDEAMRGQLQAESEASWLLAAAHGDLVGVYRKLTEARAVAAGTGSWSVDTLLGFTEAEVQGMTLSLQNQIIALTATTEEVRKNTLANLDSVIAMKMAEEGSESHVESLRKYRDAQVELWKAIDENAKKGSSGRNDFGRTAIEKAKTAVQELKNEYNEAMGVIRDAQTQFDIGPLTAHAQAVELITQKYGEMIATLSATKGDPNLKGSERQRIDTDIEKLLGEQAAAIRKANEELVKQQDTIGDALEAVEIQIGKKVLSARESWLREFAAKNSDHIKAIEADIAALDSALATAILEGNADEINRITAALAGLRKTLAGFKNAKEFGAWVAEVRDGVKKSSDAIKSLEQEVQHIGNRAGKNGLFGVLLGDSAAFNQANQALIARIRQTIREIEADIEQARASGSFEIAAELELKRDDFQRKLEAATQEIDPTLARWGDSLADYIADGIVNGFESSKDMVKNLGAFLRRELVNSIAVVLRQQWTIAIQGIFSGGTGQQSGQARPGAVGPTGGQGSPGGNVSIFDALKMSDLGGLMIGGTSLLNHAGVAYANMTGTGIDGLLSATGGYGTMPGGAFSAAMPYLPAVMNLIAGDVKGAALSAAGAYLGSFLPIPGGSFIGAFIGDLIGGLIGGSGERFKRTLSGRQGYWDSDRDEWVSTGDSADQFGRHMPGRRQFGDEMDDALESLQEGFAQRISSLLGAFGIEEDISTAAHVRLRRTSGRIAGAFFGEVGGERYSIDNEYGGDAELQQSFEDFVTDVMTRGIAAAVEASPLAQNIKDIFAEGLNVEQTDFALDALINAATSLSDLDRMPEVFSRLQTSIEEVINAATFKELQNAAEDLAELNNSMSYFYNTFTSDAEKFVDGTRALDFAFADLGMSVPLTVKEFYEIADALDLSTEEGRELFNELMALAPAFLEITNSIESFYNSFLTESEVFNMAQWELVESFKELGLTVPATSQEFYELITSLDLTTEEGRALHNELIALAPAFMTVATAIENLFAAIEASTEDTIEKFLMDTMSDREKYSYYDDRLADTIEELFKANDPASVAKLYEQAMADLQAAWALLSETEKNRLLDEYIERARQIEEAAKANVEVNPDQEVEIPVEQTDYAEYIHAQQETNMYLQRAAMSFEATAEGYAQAAEQFKAAATAMGYSVTSLPDRIVVEVNVKSNDSEITM